MKKSKNKKIYLDYASTTPVDPRVMLSMRPFFGKKFGNTASLHFFGQEAKIALEQSRDIVAKIINARSNEIVFTGSATESNNLALKGMAFARKKGHIIISSIEHPCVLESAKWLEKQGFEITVLKVNKEGLISPESVAKVIKKNTFLVSIIHASNEIGTIQSIEKIGKIIKSKARAQKSKIYFHIDASQSFGRIPIDVEKARIDMLTASSHKIYGPKGAALLYVRDGVELEPILHGGGQESGLRSSTINLAAIVGFAEACRIYSVEAERENKRLIRLREKMIKQVLKIKGSYLNGHPKQRLPNNASFRFDFVEGESLVVQLDLKGIAVSTGSACSSLKLEPSHVLLALGLKHEQAHGSLRVTLGRWTTEQGIDYFCKTLPQIIRQLRSISPF